MTTGIADEMTPGRQIPAFTSVVTDEAIELAVFLIDRSGVVPELSALMAKTTGRRRVIPLRALLVALLVLALDDRALHLKAATRLMFEQLSGKWRQSLGITGESSTRLQFLARYRQVRYLFHAALAVIDPSTEAKNRVESHEAAAERKKKLSAEDVGLRTERLQKMISALVDSSLKVLESGEFAGYGGSVGLDATPVPLYSRGPSKTGCTTASDPDGGWYTREGDHDGESQTQAVRPGGKKRTKSKSVWALEATIVVMGRAPGSPATYPNLVLAISLGKPAVTPGLFATRLLDSVQKRRIPAGLLGADRGYTQGKPEGFHLPAKAMGYSVVMDYKVTDLGLQDHAEGAILVEGQFYCPAMPEPLVTATADYRFGLIDEQTRSRLIAARQAWQLVNKQGPDAHGHVRLACPAVGPYAKLCCSLRGEALGQIPVLNPPAVPPKICCQSSVTIAPEAGARFRQRFAFGSKEWAEAYAAYRNTVEGQNAYMKDTAHEALANPDRRRVRGIAAQSLFAGLLTVAANIRKIAAFRQMKRDGLAEKQAERAKARKRRTSLQNYLPERT